MENQELKKAVQLMVEGKEEGFNTVYSAACSRVYFRARQLMKTEQDAEDLVQTVFVEAYKNIASLQAAEALFSWLDGITYRQGMKMFRKHSEVLLSEEGEGMFDILENEDISTMPELTADQKATSEILSEIIEELPELQKAALLAYYYDNRKVEEIAEWMGCSSGTVKSRLNYARKYMKERIEERERKEGYRLHAAGLPALVFAIRLMSGKMAITRSAAQRIYEAACRQLGLKAAAIRTIDSGETQNQGCGGEQLGTEGSSGAGTQAGAGAEGMKTASSSAKAAKLAGFLLAAGVVIGGTVYLAGQSRTEEPEILEEQIELSAETGTEEPEEVPEPGPEAESQEAAEEPVEESAEDLSWARELYDALIADHFEPVIAALEDREALAEKCAPYLLEEWAETEEESAYRLPVSDTEVLGVLIYQDEKGYYASGMFIGWSDGKEGFETIGVGDKLALITDGEEINPWDVMYTVFDGTTDYTYFDAYGEGVPEVYTFEGDAKIAQWHYRLE